MGESACLASRSPCILVLVVVKKGVIGLDIFVAPGKIRLTRGNRANPAKSKSQGEQTPVFFGENASVGKSLALFRNVLIFCDSWRFGHSKGRI